MDKATRSFLASALVLALLMAGAGVLVRALPAGSYQRMELADGSSAIVPASYAAISRPEYPAWRVLSAPLEVLGSEDGALAAVIIGFIVIVGGAFSTLRQAGVLEESVRSLARRFGARRRLFLAAVCLFFMLIGSFMGIFEEVVPLVPLAVSLSLSLGWDVFTGLGMSILAVGFGFSAAIANPFSVGTAQRLAGVPVMSGFGFRLFAFALVYALYLSFMLAHVRRLERGGGGTRPLSAAKGQGSGTLADGSHEAAKGQDSSKPVPGSAPRPDRGAVFFAWGGALLAFAVVLLAALRLASDYMLPLIALGFLAIGCGAGLVSGMKPASIARSFLAGALGVLPAGLLILMALSVKRIIVAGGVMDTILYGASKLLGEASGYGAAAIMYAVTLGMNFFIGSASAKAFLLMPVLAPLADLAGLSRQIAVQAFAFGDGFSNMLYPTNAVLLISLGLAGMSWGSWLKKTWLLQFMALFLTAALLMLAVAIGYA